MARDAIIIDNPAPNHLPFSPAVRAGELLFASGQVGVDPATQALIKGVAAVETDQILKNIAAVLAAAGNSLGDVVKANIYLADMADYAAMNAAYAKAFDQPYPARTCVGVAALPLGARVEIEAIVR